MGLCMSAEKRAEKKRTREIDEKNWEDHVREDRKIKVLLLGAGESGKSTVFKQMKLQYGEGFTDLERLGYRAAIRVNVREAGRALIAYAETIGLKWETAGESAAALKEGLDIDFDTGIAEHLRKLWADPALKALEPSVVKEQLTDRGHYFFQQLDKVLDETFVPTDADILRCRVRTTGIAHQEFNVEDSIFVMYDVGGQRTERRKWIHCFEGVSAVVFVVAISAFDQVLEEAPDTNRLVEAYQVFSDVCNSRWFVDAALVLFLNKTDLFREKLVSNPLIASDPKTGSLLFPDYMGGHDYDAALDYMTKKFRAAVTRDKSVYITPTCATDPKSFGTMFESTKEVILRNILRSLA